MENEEMMNDVYDEIYFHSDKMEMEDQFVSAMKANKRNITKKAKENSRYVGYEICLGGYWTDDGDFVVESLQGVELKTAIKI